MTRLNAKAISPFKVLWLASSAGAILLCASMPVLAQTLPTQDIYEEDLGAAAAYDVGIIDASQGAMSPTLWNGTNVDLALAAIKAAPTQSKSAATMSLVSSALLSGGSPPQGGENSDAYIAARLGHLVAMGRGDYAQQILDRRSDLASAPLGKALRADAALSSGQPDQACLIADGVEEQRGEPYWAKLRAFCHVLRAEIPAAELTADLLKRSGHEADAFYNALRLTTGVRTSKTIQADNDPLLKAMAEHINADKADDKPSTPKAALDRFISDAPSLPAGEFANRLTALAALGITDEADVGGYFDLDETLADTAPAAWGKLYGVVKTSTDAGVTAKAAGGLLARARNAGIFAVMARQLNDQLSFIPAQLKAQYDVDSYTRLAILDGDLGALRTYYESVSPDDPKRARIALASDAIGNGFVLGELGQDMTDRLQTRGSEKRRAVRDAILAISLGARMSAQASESMSAYSDVLSGRAAHPADLWGMKDAAARGAQAETALRAAAILGEGGPSALRADSVGLILEALNAVGLRDMAARLAAEDFIE